MPARGEGGTRGEPLTVGFVARCAVAVLALWALANLLWLGRDVLFVALVAVLAASFLSIFVDRLTAAGVPRAAAAVAVLLALLGGGAALGLLLWPTLRVELGELRTRLPEAAAELWEWGERGYAEVVGSVGRPGDAFRAQLEARVSATLARWLTGAIPLLGSVVGIAAGLFATLATALYLAIEPGLYVRALERLAPASRRGQLRRALFAVGHTLRRWIVGVTIDMAIVGLLTGVGLWLLGIPAALALAVLAGLLEFIPFWGPILAALPGVALAFVLSPLHALWAALVYAAVQQVEGNVLHPLVMRGAVRLPPAVTLLFQLLMALAFGFLGLLVAVPLLAAVRAFVGEWERAAGGEGTGAAPAGQPGRA